VVGGRRRSDLCPVAVHTAAFLGDLGGRSDGVEM
jgi:hypothetical protein